ncbi:MAG TPA: inositol monophosphatase family protein [Actinomycetota bacterium]
MEELREAALRGVLEGGRVVREAALEGTRTKGAGDYVTEVDHEAERVIATRLEEGTGIGVRGEEHGGEAAGRHWLVDPVDGTTNLVHGFPVVGVSVALIEEGRPLVGAVHAPHLGATWTAVRGGGAERDGRPLAVSSRQIGEAIVATGFPFRHKNRLPEYLRVFVPALHRFEDLRRPGAASLDLAWVAEGTFDGFFELGLSSWDVAAGALLIEEAGGLVSDWAGGDGYLGGDILAGNPEVHAALLELAQALA